MSPNLNAVVERFIQTCLVHFVVPGERHLKRIVAEVVRYNTSSGRIGGWGIVSRESSVGC